MQWKQTVSGVLFGASALASASAWAGPGAPVVVPGMGPDPATRAAGMQRVARAEPSPLGGGFIELLLTGRDPSPRGRTIAAPQPAPQPMPYATPEPAPYQPAPPQQTAYIPPASGLAVRHAMNPIFQKQEVDYAGTEKPGTIVIDTPNKFLYLVEGNGRALRYGVGVGRPGFSWAGVKTVTRKAEWPDWTPPPEMLLRRPDLPTHMAGGPENPLGARAMYLGSSLYRIHGTNEPDTIGTNVSSGCIRMMNEDVVDLYERVKVGTKVIVM